MLWPIGRVNMDVEPMSALVANFPNLATLYKSARASVDDVVEAGPMMPEIMIHIDDGGISLCRNDGSALSLPMV
jgi:hypothetical protein